MFHWKEHKLSLVGFTCLGACVQLDSLELRSKSSTTGSLSGRLRRVGFARPGVGVVDVFALQCLEGRQAICALAFGVVLHLGVFRKDIKLQPRQQQQQQIHAYVYTLCI